MACWTPNTGSASARVGCSRSGRNDRYIGSLCSMSVLQFVGMQRVGADASRRDVQREFVDAAGRWHAWRRRTRRHRDPCRARRPWLVSIRAAVEPVAMIEAPSLRCGKRGVDRVDGADQVGVDDIGPRLRPRLALHAGDTGLRDDDVDLAELGQHPAPGRPSPARPRARRPGRRRCAGLASRRAGRFLRDLPGSPSAYPIDSMFRQMSTAMMSAPSDARRTA